MTDTTAQLAAHRDDTYRDVAGMHDISAYALNRMAKQNRGNDRYPFEVSGDALAIYKATHS